MRHIHSTPVRVTQRLSLLLPLMFSGLSIAAEAQITNTWTGLGTNSNWSTPGNWNSKGVPASAASTGIDFTGSAATSNNNLGTFQLNAIQFDVTADLTLSGNALKFVSNGGTTPVLTQNTGFAVTLNNNLTLTTNLTVNMAGSGAVNLTGAISGAGSLTVSGSNAAYTTILSSVSNSYTGGTIVAGGTLQLGANTALTTGKNLTLTGTTVAATLDLNGHIATVGNINFADGTANSVNNLTITDSSAGATGLLTLNGNITYNPGTDSNGNNVTPTAYMNTNLALSSGQHVLDNNGTGAYSNQNYDIILSGAISGNGGIDLGTVNDANTGLYAVLAHTNTYAGPTNIVNGSLYLGATNALSAQGAVTIGPTGNLYLYIASDYTQTGLAPGSYNQTIGSLADNGTAGSGFVYLGGATLTVGSNNTSTTFSGSIQDNDGTSADTSIMGGSLVKVGTGTLTLSGQSLYTGNTIINAGTLQLGISDALPDTNNGAAVNTNLMLNGGNFDTNANSQIVNNLTNQGGNVLIQGGGSVLTVSGPYTQSSGTTQVDDTLNLTPGQDLKITGGQLVGLGTIGNATSSGTITVTNAGGTVRPADLLSPLGTPLSVAAPGTLTINGNYTQTSGGKLEIDLAGTEQGSMYDLLAVSNTANLAGTLDVKLLNGFVPTNGEQFDFLTYGTLTGGFNNVVGLDPGYNYGVSFANGVGTLTVSVAAVPESSTLLSAVLMVGAGTLLHYRRKRSA